MERREYSSFIAAGALLLALVFINHGYGGLRHDGRIYTLQALAHLQPELYAQDVYLRYGSQDGYTLFSPIYAAVAGRIGVEPAAAWLTFGATLAWLAGAFALAACCMPARIALIAVGLLVALPDDYGSNGIFRCLENFVSARLPAEALTLAGLAAVLCARTRLACACLGAATLLHPLMAGAGWALWAALRLPRPAWKWLGAVLATAGLATVIALHSTALRGALQFDPSWFAVVVVRFPFLFLSRWEIADWSNVAVSGTTLLLQWRCLDDARLRRLAGMSLLLGAGGLAATAVGSDWLHLILVTQIQPWRVLWLLHVVAVLMSVPLVLALWRAGRLGRAGALLLATLWLMRGETYVFELAPLTLAAGWWSRARVPEAVAKWSLPAAALLLAFAVTWCILNNLLLSGRYYSLTLASPGMNRLRGIMWDGLVPAALVAITAWLAAMRRRGATATLWAAALGAWLSLAPIAYGEWSYRVTTTEFAHRIERWRSRIPPGAEVLWPENPMAVWVLLQRPSYISRVQTNSALFSRAAALELNARASAVAPYLDGDNLMRRRRELTPGRRPTHATLRELCAHGTMSYVVSKEDLDAPDIDRLPLGSPGDGGMLRLYPCPGRG
jgi:hypothetical protein